MIIDINSDYGIVGSDSEKDFTVTGSKALLNFIKNLNRTSTGSDRFDYVTMGLDLEKRLQEPPTTAMADQIFMMLRSAFEQYIPMVKLDISRSKVVCINADEGDYYVLLIANAQSIEFYL